MVRHFTTHVIVCKNIKRDGGSTSLSFYNPGDCLPKTQGKKGKYKYSYKPFFFLSIFYVINIASHVIINP